MAGKGWENGPSLCVRVDHHCACDIRILDRDWDYCQARNHWVVVEKTGKPFKMRFQAVFDMGEAHATVSFGCHQNQFTVRATLSPAECLVELHERAERFAGRQIAASRRTHSAGGSERLHRGSGHIPKTRRRGRLAPLGRVKRPGKEERSKALGSLNFRRMSNKAIHAFLIHCLEERTKGRVIRFVFVVPHDGRASLVDDPKRPIGILRPVDAELDCQSGAMTRLDRPCWPPGMVIRRAHLAAPSTQNYCSYLCNTPLCVDGRFSP